MRGSTLTLSDIPIDKKKKHNFSSPQVQSDDGRYMHPYKLSGLKSCDNEFNKLLY